MIISLRALPPWKIAAALGPLVLIGVLGVGLTRDPSFIPSAVVGNDAPSFDLPALDGDDRVRLADHKGKITVVNFWASWCTACRNEHDVLVELGNTYAGDPAVSFLGINFRDRDNAARKYLADQGAYPYPSGRDPGGRTGIDYGVYGLPETFFLDEQGRVARRHVGALDRATADTILAELGVGR
ncbi:MAG: redoxin domain-containing protein [Pseudaminobacter sp.]